MFMQSLLSKTSKHIQIELTSIFKMLEKNVIREVKQQ